MVRMAVILSSFLVAFFSVELSLADAGIRCRLKIGHQLFENETAEVSDHEAIKKILSDCKKSNNSERCESIAPVCRPNPGETPNVGCRVDRPTDSLIADSIARDLTGSGKSQELALNALVFNCLEFANDSECKDLQNNSFCIGDR